MDTQNVNNVISNRENKVSYISQGFIKYDETKHTLTITKKGKDFIEEKYSNKRS